MILYDSTFLVFKHHVINLSCLMESNREHDVNSRNKIRSMFSVTVQHYVMIFLLQLRTRNNFHVTWYQFS